ncbi:unnamed protein product, partial [Nesidiocoris tenuis]
MTLVKVQIARTAQPASANRLGASVLRDLLCCKAGHAYQRLKPPAEKIQSSNLQRRPTAI